MEPAFAPSLDDAALLQRYAGASDAAAFAELVRRYAGMVYATARRVTGDPSAAEDVSQDCFLRLARASHGIEGSLPAWLHRTSLNRSLELVRSDRARRRREAASAQTRDGDARASDDESTRLIAHVDEAMGQLPDELRVILAEHFLVGRTQQDIAQQLGVDQSTVSRRIDRALDQLRASLRAAGVGVAALPTVMASAAVRATTASTPPALHASLTKIGLSGVRHSGGGGAAHTPPPSAVASAKLGTHAAFVTTAVAAAALVVVIGGAYWLRSDNATGGKRTPPPTAAATASPTTAPSMKRATANDDDGDDDDKDDDDKDDADDKKDSKLEPLFDHD
jgi:RNA polymerase sigma factor (sigma-70 family)